MDSRGFLCRMAEKGPASDGLLFAGYCRSLIPSAAVFAIRRMLLRLLDGRFAKERGTLGLRGLHLELMVGILIEHVDRRLVDELVGHIITSYRTSGVDGFGSYLTPNNRSP